MNHPYFEYTDVDRRFYEERLDPHLPERIFDAHRHVQLPEHLDESEAPFKRGSFPEGIAGPESIEQARMAYAIMFPGREVEMLAFGSPQSNVDASANNAYVSEEFSGDLEGRGEAHTSASQSFGLALNRPDWDADRLIRELRLPAIIGVKPYERLNREFEGGDASIFDFMPHHQLELLDELGAWLTLHLPRKERLADRENIEEILELRARYPNLVLVVAHLGRSYAGRYAREGFPPLAEDPGILFDNSAVLNPAVHALALDRFGPERIMWASDQPVFYMRGRRRWEGDRYINLTSGDYAWNTDREPPEVEATYTLSLYEQMAACIDTTLALGFGEETIEALFHDNARRKIDEVLARKERW
ncbi:MAG: amidohydrolase family protein [Armatimonadota bacterium]